MWKDTNNGAVKQFETRQKELVTVEVNGNKEVLKITLSNKKYKDKNCYTSR